MLRTQPMDRDHCCDGCIGGFCLRKAAIEIHEKEPYPKIWALLSLSSSSARTRNSARWKRPFANSCLQLPRKEEAGQKLRFLRGFFVQTEAVPKHSRLPRPRRGQLCTRLVGDPKEYNRPHGNPGQYESDEHREYRDSFYPSRHDMPPLNIFRQTLIVRCHAMVPAVTRFPPRRSGRIRNGSGRQQSAKPAEACRASRPPERRRPPERADGTVRRNNPRT